MQERFEEIYARNEWGHGSGEGSLIAHTEAYIQFINQFLGERSIESVVDMGCGDWQFSKYISWGSAKYVGFDVVKSVIERNCQAYSTDTITFSHYSGNPSDLPGADLLIVKDVLQHLSDEEVLRFIPFLRNFRYALLTNCVDPKGPTVNRDIQTGGCRYLDLRLPPFNLEARQVFEFSKTTNPLTLLFRAPKWKKIVLLVEATNSRCQPVNSLAPQCE